MTPRDAPSHPSAGITAPTSIELRIHLDRQPDESRIVGTLYDELGHEHAFESWLALLTLLEAARARSRAEPTDAAAAVVKDTTTDIHTPTDTQSHANRPSEDPCPTPSACSTHIPTSEEHHMLHTTTNSTLLRAPARPWGRNLCMRLAALAIVVAFGATTAQAKTRHHYTSVIHSAPLATGHGYPAVGGTAALAGTWATSLLGTGALVDHLTITSHPTPTTFTFKGAEVGFVALGTFKDTFTGTATVQPNGSQTLVTHGRFTGGTGPYRGASGSFKFTGATAPGSNVVNGHSAGTLTY
jgi:hypothetical protein